MKRERTLGLAKRALGVLGLVLVVAFVAVVVAYSFPQLVGAEESYVVIGGSMEPTLGLGDVVFVYDADPATVEEGDILTYQSSGEPVPTTHRVVDAVHDGDVHRFQTKGDANPSADAGTIPGEAVIGVVPVVDVPLVGPVPLSVPLVGYLINFGRTPTGFVALVMIPLALGLADEARRSLAAHEAESDSSSDGGGGSDHEAEGASGESSPTVVSFSPEELRSTVVVLALFAVYAAFVAAQLRTAWSVGVAVAVFGLLAVAFFVVRSAEPPAPPSVTDGGREGGGDEDA